MLTDIDLSRIDTKPIRLNISLPAYLVQQIDAYAVSVWARYLDGGSFAPFGQCRAQRCLIIFRSSLAALTNCRGRQAGSNTPGLDA
jgi:hypothetical protein